MSVADSNGYLFTSHIITHSNKLYYTSIPYQYKAPRAPPKKTRERQLIGAVSMSSAIAITMQTTEAQGFEEDRSNVTYPFRLFF